MNFHRFESGEAGHRRGSDFENASANLLAQLGYTILDQNFDIPCLEKDKHKTPSHGIDIFAKFSGKRLLKPLRSPLGACLISCKSGLGNIEDHNVDEMKNALECLKKSGRDKVTGAILITLGKVKPPQREIFQKSRDLFWWDINYIIFNAVKASNFQTLGCAEYKIDNKTTALISHRLNNVILFHEGGRINDDLLNSYLTKCLGKMPFWIRIFGPRETYVEIHSLDGFTTDMLGMRKKIVKLRGKWLGYKRAIINPDTFIDYTFPWNVILRFSLMSREKVKR